MIVNNNKEIQELVAEAARGWLGTPFHHQGRKKHIGVDCLGLLVGVAEELSIKSRNGRLLNLYDNRHYSHTPDGYALVNRLSALLYETSADEIIAGDVGVFAIDGSPQHLGIIGKYDHGLSLIHAYAPARKVVEHALDDFWKMRMTAAFRVADNQ